MKNSYYEEFLRPRASTLGLRDYLRMQLLPPLEGLYRQDLWAHEPDLWGRYRSHPLYRRLDAVDGVLLSHAHLDHSGSIGFLYPEIPVFTGVASAVISKALQDTRAAGPDYELCYLSPRTARSDGVLEGARGQRTQRRYLICEDVEVADDLRDFWCTLKAPRTELDPCPLERADVDTLGLRFWRVDHSIPGSGAFGVETPAGWVVYTGDLRSHGHSAWRVQRFVEEAAALRPALLIVEGTRVSETESIGEIKVHEAAAEAVAKTDGLTVADFGPRSVERLRTFYEIAKEQGRRLVVLPADGYLLHHLRMVDPAIPGPGSENLAILKEPQGQTQSWARWVFDTFASCVVDAAEVRRDQGAHILCLSFWDIANLIDIEPNGGTYIYSSSEAYTEEQAIDQQRLINWLRYFGLEIVGGLPGAEIGPYHSSGHADGRALEQMIETVDPERILPVHTEDLGWFESRWASRLVQASLGQSQAIA